MARKVVVKFFDLILVKIILNDIDQLPAEHLQIVFAELQLYLFK